LLDVFYRTMTGASHGKRDRSGKSQTKTICVCF
jgi:hypothetical protein